MLCAGIDAGSRCIKVLLFDTRAERVVCAGYAGQGVPQRELAHTLYHDLLRDAGLDAAAVRAIVATGYGRARIDFADTTITEITCHARGVRHHLPDVRTIVEIGGQDSKLMRLNGTGDVRDFVMNDRCAAGTGRFIEVVAERLGVTLDEMGALAGQSRAPARISSTCVVFAETEIVGLLASGAAPPDIVAGVLRAISNRVGAMAGRTVDAPVAFTGGVAMIPGMQGFLEESLGTAVVVPAEPQMTGALGAALLAATLHPREEAGPRA